MNAHPDGASRYWRPVAAFGVLVLAWQAAASAGLFSSKVFPTPAQCLAGLVEVVRDGRLFSYTVASLFRVTVGWYIAVLLAIPLGIVLGGKAALQEAINPLLQFLRPISPLAWIPLAMIWFGIGDPPAVFLIFLASFFPLVVATMGAVAGIKPLYVRAARNMGLQGSRLVLRVVLPATLPSIIVSLRISVGIAWLVVVAAEMIAVKSGLGFLIIDARNALRLDLVVVGMVVIGLIGIVLDRAIRRLEQLPSLGWSLARQR
ncbi:sulfonate transport system permease protein [Gammaproteobacteria bacterium]|nr:sulfonate transport system permease protein [Gammaproteobacteria bacterium]